MQFTHGVGLAVLVVALVLGGLNPSFDAKARTESCSDVWRAASARLASPASINHCYNKVLGFKSQYDLLAPPEGNCVVVWNDFIMRNAKQKNVTWCYYGEHRFKFLFDRMAPVNYNCEKIWKDIKPIQLISDSVTWCLYQSEWFRIKHKSLGAKNFEPAIVNKGASHQYPKSTVKPNNDFQYKKQIFPVWANLIPRFIVEMRTCSMKLDIDYPIFFDFQEKIGYLKLRLGRSTSDQYICDTGSQGTYTYPSAPGIISNYVYVPSGVRIDNVSVRLVERIYDDNQKFLGEILLINH